MRIDGPPPISVALLKVWTGSPAQDPAPQPPDTVQEATNQSQMRAMPAEPTPPVAGRLRIEFDKAAGVYVQTLSDPMTDEVLRKYPSEAQLGFARAVRAYLMAKFTA